jgi:hypothetical protein
MNLHHETSDKEGEEHSLWFHAQLQFRLEAAVAVAMVLSPPLTPPLCVFNDALQLSLSDDCL